jgi:glutamate-5-semialdehyde dehydrogenase
MLRSVGENGHVVAEFGTGEGKKKFKHRDIGVGSVPF